MTTPTPEPPTTYATAELVRNTLGGIGTQDRLPEYVDVDAMLIYGHALAVDALANVYPDKMPTFTGPALKAVALAEARLTAAEILDQIRVMYPDQAGEADQLRASAFATLSDGLPGFPPGSSGSTDPGDDGTPGVSYGPGPRVSSFTPASAVADPYEDLRGTPGLGFL